MMKKTSFLLIATLLIHDLGTTHAADGGQLSETDKEFLTEHHNEERGLTARGLTEGQPMARNMLKLEWDEKIAESSKGWADRCKFEHDHDSGYGENLAVAGAFTDVVDNIETLINGVDEWYEEFHQYDYETGECAFGECGHYTQSLWSTSFKIGCAYAECAFPDFFLPAEVDYGVLLVCRYNPRGNWLGVKPYIQANSMDEVASECPGGFAANSNNGLCENDGSATTPPYPNPSGDSDPIGLGGAPCRKSLERLFKKFV